MRTLQILRYNNQALTLIGTDKGYYVKHNVNGVTVFKSPFIPDYKAALHLFKLKANRVVKPLLIRPVAP